MLSKIALLLAASTMLSACGAVDRVANIGKAPDLEPISNPAASETVQTVSMPMPAKAVSVKEANSLWSSDKKSFFKDQRAADVGDILTVMIDIDDEAELENETERRRTSSEDAGMNNLLGIEADLAKVFPEEVDNVNLVGLGATSISRGTGSIERDEEVRLKLAAVVTQMLPNGNMVIVGRQEVRVNFEKRILEFAGVIRPEDITIENTIPYEKVAEARISYGGKGQITDLQQPRYGQQLYDIIFPF
ncbi:MAG: flagellar basal body L-ring protein FlgH [Pseudobdellovibrionaceae bacterium]